MVGRLSAEGGLPDHGEVVNSALIRNLSSGQKLSISENLYTFKMGEAFLDLALIAGNLAV
jgi:hypothetical protein